MNAATTTTGPRPKRKIFTAEEASAVHRALEGGPRFLAFVSTMLTGAIAVRAKEAPEEIEAALAPLALEVAWDAPGSKRGLVLRAVHFRCDDEPELYSLHAMLASNVDDVSVCRWLRNAEPGDVFPEIVRVECIAGPVPITMRGAELVDTVIEAVKKRGES